MHIEIEMTEDGSHTLFVAALDEHYHSTHGAIGESTHIFIEAGLRHCPNEALRVLEVGFGTGLNAFLTLLEADRSRRKIEYLSLERYPVAPSLAEKLNYAERIDPSKRAIFNALHTADWEQPVPITPFFTLRKICLDFRAPEGFACDEPFDLIYFDAFAPGKQPEMWSQAIFDRLYALSAPNAVLTTYCAKGAVRRMMQAAGFAVERLPGPPGKREILRARKQEENH